MSIEQIMNELKQIDKANEKVSEEITAIKILTELNELLYMGGDTKAKLKAYIAKKEKELGI